MKRARLYYIKKIPLVRLKDINLKIPIVKLKGTTCKHL